MALRRMLNQLVASLTLSPSTGVSPITPTKPPKTTKKPQHPEKPRKPQASRKPRELQKPQRQRKPQKTWSMLPDQHLAVLREVKVNKLSFNFHDRDEDKSIKSWDTSIHGKFTCKNPNCTSEGWSSKAIATTIRLYPHRGYNARVYHQRCARCDTLSRPEVAVDVYAERVSYWLKKWSGVEVKKPDNGRTDNQPKPPHESRLCEGCKAGHCKYSKNKEQQDD